MKNERMIKKFISIVLSIVIVFASLNTVPMRKGVNAAGASEPSGVGEIVDGGSIEMYSTSYLLKSADGSPCTFIMNNDSEIGYYNSTGELTSLNIGMDVCVIVDSSVTFVVASSITTANGFYVKNGGYAIVDGRVENFSYVDSGGTAIINGTISGQFHVTVGGAATINGTYEGAVTNGGTVTMSTLSIPMGYSFENYSTGTLVLDSFDPGNIEGSFINAGIIEATDIVLYNTGNFSSEKTDSFNPTYRVTNSIQINISSSPIGTIIANEGTDIIVPSGNLAMFDLDVGGTTKTIEYLGGGTYKAGSLLKEDINITSTHPSSFYYGEDYNPLDYITSNSDGEITVSYSQAAYPGSDYFAPLSARPTDVGFYRVTVEFAESTNYKADTCEEDYEIIYLTTVDAPTMGASITTTPKVDGETYKYYDQPVEIKANDGFEISIDGTSFSESVSLDEDGYYNGTFGYIRRKSDHATSGDITIDASSFYVDTTKPEVVATSVKDQDGDTPGQAVEDGASFHAKKIDFDIKDLGGYYGALKSVSVNGTALAIEGDNIDTAHVSLTTEKADTTYEIVAEDYVGNKLEMNVTLEYKDEATSTVLLEDSYYGAALPDPTVVTSSDCDPSLFEISYKEVGQEDDALTTTKPTAVGNYEVRAYIPATDNYLESFGEDTFKILYLPTPEEPYRLQGTSGEHSYYTSDVSIIAKEGYKLSTSIDGTYSASIPYSGTISKLWLKRDYDGAITDEIPFAETVLIDKEPPVISEGGDQNGLSYELSDGMELKVRSLSFDVTDDNLASVKVNGTSYPVADGKASVTLSIPRGSKEVYSIETEDVAGLTNNISLNIEYSYKLFPTSTINVSDLYVGEEFEPVFTTDSDGKDDTSIEYKLKAADDTAYTTVKPEMAGEYTVRATVPETETYEESICTDDFTISKKTPSVATVEVEDTIWGEEYEPVLTTDSDGKVSAVISYKKSDEADSTYTTTKPSEAGSYIVRAVVPETDMYLSITCADTFTISKKTPGYATVTIDDLTVGETYSPILDTDSDGAALAVFSYKKVGSDDSTYSTTKPTAGGNYVVKASVPETSVYNAIECTDDFKINKKTALSAELIIPSTMAGEEYEPVVSTDSDGASKAVIRYKKDGESEYSTIKPKAAGDYSAIADIPETDSYYAITASTTFSINMNTPSIAEVAVSDIYVGDEIIPVLTTDSDGKDKATFSYKKNDDEDMTFSDTKPTKAGSYIIKASIPETELYYATSCTSTFKISKRTVEQAVVAVANVTYGNQVVPVLTTDSDGKNKATFEYKKSDDDDSSYSSTVPTEVGEYTVRANIPETEKYLAAECTGKFKIVRKLAIKAVVTVADTTVGTEYEPVLTTDSDGKEKAVFEYKKSGEEDSEYNTTKPTKAGKYIVRATIPETEKYDKIICTGSFTIKKKTAKKASVKVSDTKVGTDYDPVLSTDSDGADKVVYQYRKTDVEDSEFFDRKPTKAGSYEIKAKVPETEMYYAIECTSEFTISKNAVTKISVSINDVYVGQKYKPVLSTDSDGAGDAIFEYKPSADEDAPYVTEKPVAAGTYTVRATVPATDKYVEASCTSEFSIKRITTDATITLGTVYAGTVYTPMLKTISDGAGGAVFSYKKFGADDNTYSDMRPIVAGNYTARVIIPATGTYESIVATTDYEIVYLDTPGNPYTPAGTVGKNGFYTSDVNLVALSGFQIGFSLNGPFADEVPYSDNIGPVYLKRISDGALTNFINVSEKYKIDKEEPSILPVSGTSGVSSIYDGASTFADMITMNIADDNLNSVLLNGSKVSVTNGTAQVMLDPLNGTKSFAIEAEDKAGNVKRFDITLMAEWLKDKVIPADKLLPLDGSESYKLGDGEWVVEGDPTVYNGGRSVYVKDSGDYTFSNGQ